jgi:hypothetical protein
MCFVVLVIVCHNPVYMFVVGNIIPLQSEEVEQNIGICQWRAISYHDIL